MKQEPLWPNLTPVDSAPMSKAFAVMSYRSSPEERPKWSAIKVKNPMPCDECAAVQHETKGAYGPRANAKQRRAFKGGPILRLCTRHANAWHERDQKDGAE